MKKQYIFIILLFFLLYLIYQIVLYKYNEYQVYKYISELHLINEKYKEQIEEAKQTIEMVTTPAYKNKSLKSQSWLKNPWENMFTLILEERYETYTQTGTQLSNQRENIAKNPLSNESLIETMSNYQKWVYLIFKKDIR